ncbi:GNAT family N-acetyltransferase [uncultured Clostridium sp.]|uniref:GNAT family N-acetyltransferase n=1 Tax=uncultured Clostridium sp. TaxID=59620 RepID=UPI00260D5878|nr:GNAT family N-acetyltransferase [uncultured Clostridium sp.]
MNHKGTVTLETKNLILRKFRKNDALPMYSNWANNPNVTKFLTWPPHENIHVTEEILNDWIKSYNKDNYYHWAITLKSGDDEPIGVISVVSQNEKLALTHIGYCISENWWHKGITSEALQAVIHFLITEVCANRVESRHDPRNPNSGKVMLKCGMKYEGTIRSGDLNNLGICDYSVYGILANELK